MSFNKINQTINELKHELDTLQNILKESDNNPELLLTEYILPTEGERVYVLTRFMVEFGEEDFNDFIFEYFDKILKVLSLKIPISEITLTPVYYNDEYVLLGTINEKPRLIINTFEKTVSYIPDDYLVQLNDEILDCQNLIYELEQKLNYVGVNNNKFTLNKKRQAEQRKEETNMLVAQLGIEKQKLSQLREAANQYQLEMTQINETLKRYASRLVSYYQFVILKTEGLE